MTYEEFRRQNRLPAQQQPKPAPRPSPPKPAPVVDASAVVRDLRSNLTRDDGQPVTGMSTADQNALYDYFQHVRALIDSGFRRPSGIVDSAKAMVEFRIKADGTVDSIRIVSSSGNKAFDDAALAAVRSIGRLSPPPGRTAYTRRIEFVADSGAR
jgi:TonB family protein